ncbi:hypothetical protein WI83_02910 [Burkholderia ubonensis]|nr:hypothetical protein WI83_02910 [Burkholderia ubonensis]
MIFVSDDVIFIFDSALMLVGVASQTSKFGGGVHANSGISLIDLKVMVDDDSLRMQSSLGFTSEIENMVFIL